MTFKVISRSNQFGINTFGISAWLSFVQHAIATKQIKDDCDYGKSIGEYFTDVCAPGVKDEYHVRSKGADQVKLCSLCKNLEGRYFIKLIKIGF